MFDTYIILYSVLSIVLIEARRVIHELIRINSKKDLNNILVYIIRKLSPRKLQWKHDQVIN
jgi:ribosomal protein S17E